MRALDTVAAISLLLGACVFDPSGPSGASAGDSDAAMGSSDAASAPIDSGNSPGPDASSSDGGTPAGILLRFNIAGPEYTGVEFAGTWAADPGVCDGGDYMLSADVNGTVDDPLFIYWQYSFSAINCAIGLNLPAGNYELTLLFGEIWIGPGCPYTGSADRIFDVYVEGALEEAALDTVAVGGCCHPDATTPGTPFARVYTVTVADGTLNLVLDALPNEQAIVSAIQLRQL